MTTHTLRTPGTSRRRRKLVADFEAQVGTHDDPKIFGGPAGDPGLAGGPGSVSWRLNRDIPSVAIAGAGAIILEMLHPSVVAGVEEHSSYRSDPFRRARTTFGYVITTTFANTQAAERLIGQVRRMHRRVTGTRPDGVPYEALDPRLIAWVHTCIPWAIMTAYDRLHEPLSIEEKDQYLAEQATIGLLGGADEVPTSVAELEAFVADVRPELALNEQNRSFIDFLIAAPFGGVELPGALPRAVTEWLTRFQLEASMGLMPGWARHLTGLEPPRWMWRNVHRPMMRAWGDDVRAAFGTPAFARLAEERALAGAIPALAGAGSAVPGAGS